MMEQTPCGQRWRTSQFNEYLGELRENKWVVYNNFSGAMIEVQKQLYDALLTNDVEALPKAEYYHALSHGKFIVPGHFNEVNEIKEKKAETNEAVSVIGLQLVPTLACNFKCLYCYEQTQYETKQMSPEIMAAVMAYITRKIKPTTQYLQVMWFGGEPLLAVNCISFLGEALLDLAQKHGIRYFAGIVTNGYLLNEKNIELLLRYQINSCQVTVDGPENIHDQRRCLRNGAKTWQNIIDNLNNAVTMGMKVSIRMNVDKTNIHSVDQLIKELDSRQILNRINLAFGLVSSFGNVCRSVEDSLLSFDHANAILKSNGIAELLKKPGEEALRPVPDFIGCVAAAGHSVIVGPSGELYKCSKSIGVKHEQCGTIFDSWEGHPNFKKWIECSNLDEEPCKYCSMLPVCKGKECAFKYIIERKNIFDCNRPVYHEKYKNKLITLYNQKHQGHICS